MRLATPKAPGPYGMEPSWRADFLSADECAGQGISLLPAATPPTVNNGVTLNGATQYARLQGNTVGSAIMSGPATELSYVLEFSPSFAYNDGVAHTLFEQRTTVIATGYRCYKWSTSVLYIDIAGVGIASIAGATYGALWRVGSRNKLAISARSGNNNVWLNGTSILAAGATAWTKIIPDLQLFIGVDQGLATFFSGTFYDFRIYPRGLTNAECSELTTIA